MAGRRFTPWKLIAVLVLAVAEVILVTNPSNRDNLRIRSALRDCRRLARDRAPGWEAAVKGRVRQVTADVKDRRRLARALLAHEDGSLVAEGMVLYARDGFDDGAEVLAAHFDDQRTNYFGDTNGHWARMCLAGWRVRRGLPLPAEDRDAAEGWEAILRNR